MTNKEELLRKIKALAERGEYGEQETAQEMLKRLMLKYNIDEKDLDDDVIENYTIRFKTEFEKKLIMQIIYAVQGDNHHFWDYSYGIKLVGYSATAAEYIEIETMFEFYRHFWEKDLDMFYLAFLQKNDIFPSRDKVTKFLDTEKLTQEEKNRMDKAALMTIAMDKHERRKQLDYETNNNKPKENI